MSSLSTIDSVILSEVAPILETQEQDSNSAAASVKSSSVMVIGDTETKNGSPTKPNSVNSVVPKMEIRNAATGELVLNLVSNPYDLSLPSERSDSLQTPGGEAVITICFSRGRDACCQEEDNQWGTIYNTNFRLFNPDGTLLGPGKYKRLFCGQAVLSFCCLCFCIPKNYFKWKLTLDEKSHELSREERGCDLPCRTAQGASGWIYKNKTGHAIGGLKPCEGFTLQIQFRPEATPQERLWMIADASLTISYFSYYRRFPLIPTTLEMAKWGSHEEDLQEFDNIKRLVIVEDPRTLELNSRESHSNLITYSLEKEVRTYKTDRLLLNVVGDPIPSGPERRFCSLKTPDKKTVISVAWELLQRDEQGEVIREANYRMYRPDGSLFAYREPVTGAEERCGREVGSLGRHLQWRALNDDIILIRMSIGSTDQRWKWTFRRHNRVIIGKVDKDLNNIYMDFRPYATRGEKLWMIADACSMGKKRWIDIHPTAYGGLYKDDDPE